MTAPLHVALEREQKLLRLRLSRPKANVIDAAMIDALQRALDEHSTQPGLRAVLLEAEGPHFSFGASVEEHLPHRCAGMLVSFHALIRTLLAYPAPVLVAVQGQCLGGGMELACAAHVAFAAPDATFAQPEVQLGVFAPAASVLLSERIGRAAAEELLLSGRSATAAEMQQRGLLYAVTDDPRRGAEAWFDSHLLKKSALALRFATRACRRTLLQRVSQELSELEDIYVEELMHSADAQEGLNAFLQKRAPHWEDR